MTLLNNLDAFWRISDTSNLFDAISGFETWINIFLGYCDK